MRCLTSSVCHQHFNSWQSPNLSQCVEWWSWLEWEKIAPKGTRKLCHNVAFRRLMPLRKSLKESWSKHWTRPKSSDFPWGAEVTRHKPHDGAHMFRTSSAETSCKTEIRELMTKTCCTSLYTLLNTLPISAFYPNDHQTKATRVFQAMLL